MREKFEKWVITQFPGFETNLLELSADGAYKTDSINTLFVGFCAGYLLAQKN
ncbi:hypothetical protein [Shewanella glacialipiscicola]|uniref:hypothetical protein n=1 Tax=Shewanella TaxID=22 RepID=UPI003D7ACCCC